MKSVIGSRASANMAEFSQSSLLAALLLFTALTVRDIYLVRSSSKRGHQPTDNPSVSTGTEAGKSAKSTVYNGPVLKFQYW